MMRLGLILVACAGVIVSQDALAQRSRAKRVGPWNVAAFHANGEFRHCIMARAETRSTPGFGIVRGRTYIAIGLFAKKWKLEKGLTYPVTLVADEETVEVQARADGDTTVLVDITGQEPFLRALADARVLQVRTPATTLSLPLDRSSAAIARLDECVAEETGIASNPFGGGQQNAARSSNPFAAPQPAPTPAPAPAPSSNPFAAARQAAQAQAQARAQAAAPAPPVPAPSANPNPFAAGQAPVPAPAPSPNPFAAAPQANASPPASPAPAPNPNPFAPPAPAPQQAAPAQPAAPPAVDPAYANLRKDCEQDDDPDRQIAGCTAVIESGRETQVVQGIASSNRGYGYSKKGDSARALASYSDAIRLHPTYPTAHWGRADVYYERKEWSAAIADYTAALKLLPKDEYILHRRARSYLNVGNTAAALQDVDEALRIKPEAASFALKGEVHLARNEPAEALPAFEEALKLSPGLAAAVEGQKKAQAATAISDLDRAIAAMAVVSAASQPCSFAPNPLKIASVAGSTGLAPEMLDAEPHAKIKRAEEERVERGLRAGKDSFCQTVWADYGSGGKKIPDLLTR